MIVRPFDVSDLPQGNLLRRALFIVQSHWHLAYAKLLAMNWAFVEDPRIPFAATDGRRLLLNPLGVDFVASRPHAVKYMAFILVHEALHGLLDHPLRASRLSDPAKANVAADYIINAMVDQFSKERGSRVHEEGGVFMMPPVGLLDPELSKDYCMEELYRILPSDPPSPGGKKDPMGDFPGMPGAPGDLIEVELEEGEELEEVIRDIEATNERIIVQSQALAGTTGPVDARLSSQRHLPKEVSWVSRVQEWARSRSEVGWLKPFHAPLFVSSGLIGAGRGGRMDIGDFVMVVDSSGSINDSTWDEFLSITQFIVDELGFKTVHLLSVDHAVEQAVSLEPGDRVPDRMDGGGGTRFRPAFDWVRRNTGDDVEGLVYLTDGHNSDGFDWGPPPYPVLWATTMIRPTGHFPWGETCKAFDL